MPLYEFHCDSCGQSSEVWLSVEDYAQFDRVCTCRGQLARVYSPTPAHNTGTDYSDPLEQSMWRRHKAYIEGQADKLATGAVSLEGKCRFRQYEPELPKRFL